MNARITIQEYDPQWRSDFDRLNRAWLEEFFELEPYDEFVLTEPETALLRTGGRIFFAVQGERAVGTAALKNMGGGVMELTKMAVDKSFQGKGIGRELCAWAIGEARKLGVRRLVLYSNRRLQAALAVYHKAGFREIPLESDLYGRADVMMERII